MPAAQHLQLIVSQPSPKTYGEGFIAGHADGYLIGRGEVKLEMLATGFMAGALFIAALLMVLR